MKFARMLLFSVLLFSLMVGSVSASGVKPASGKYTGTIKSGKNFKFTVSGGKIKSVSADVLEYCDGSLYSNWTTVYFKGPFKVSKNGTINAKGKEKHGKVSLVYTFTGKFSSSKKATGTLSQSTVVVGSVCKTYKLKWSAKKK